MSKLQKYIIKRLLQAPVIIICIILVNFTIIHLAPGDPTLVLFGDSPIIPEVAAKIRHDFGLDRPLYEQLFIYIVQILTGNLGFSFYYREPVLTVLLPRLGNTFLLIAVAYSVASLLGILLGMEASRRQYSLKDNVISVLTLVTHAVPIFWLGMMLLIVFSLYLGLFPAGGMTSFRGSPGGFGYVVDVLYHMVLPTLTLGLKMLTLNMRMTRAKMLDVLEEDYITLARAKGLDETTVIYRHAFRNALLPIVTILGFNIGEVILGSALLEIVFSWPGIGRLMYDAIFARDFPVVMGIFLIISIIVVLANLLTDISYSYLDPRVRYR